MPKKTLKPGERTPESLRERHPRTDQSEAPEEPQEEAHTGSVKARVGLALWASGEKVNQRS